jgi:hypothetical protein
MDSRNAYLRDVLPIGSQLILRSGAVTYDNANAANTVKLQQVHSSCAINGSLTTTRPVDCGLSLWPNINQVPYNGIKQGVDNADMSVVRNRARLLFDGAIITMHSLDVTTDGGSNILRVGGICVSSIAERDSSRALQHSTTQVTRWRVQYVDDSFAVNDQRNNCFRLISEVGDHTIFNFLHGYYGNADGSGGKFYADNCMTIRAAFVPTGNASYYYFAFQGGAIAGLMSLANPGYLLRPAVASFIQPLPEALSHISVYFHIASPNAFMQTLNTLQLGECCTKGFGTETIEKRCVKLWD